jgi:hypothetical protein
MGLRTNIRVTSEGGKKNSCGVVHIFRLDGVNDCGQLVAIYEK